MNASYTNAVKPAANGVASEVPDQVVVAEFAFTCSLSVVSPVADQPTATMSGSSLPCELGPRLDQDDTWPNVLPAPPSLLLAAPTDITPGAPPGLATVP